MAPSPARLRSDARVPPRISVEKTIATAIPASAAAGDRDRAAGLLEHAAQWDRAHPTYYGAAWFALGRVMLTTLGPRGCPPM